MIERIGVLGGTFNPIHRGHIYLAGEFAKRLSLSRVLLIPTFLPPHKRAEQLAPGGDRLAMCRIAAAGDPRLAVSDIELAREGRSFTVDTLSALAAPGVRHYLLMGADMFLTLESWRDFAAIARMADLCAAARGEESVEQLLCCARKLEERYGARCHVERIPPVDVSSTRIRRKIAAGEEVETLVHPGVLAYIRQKGLYGI